ncbi:MBL fold metallo-hydrolase [Undibacterium parvum]|uniref:Hydrolase n=2 Tax=Undibacterium TaxID=401469 RepID=A0A6M4A1U9_9BURK|nr:MBL fold metallo-hydrolase [Undibacterium parvum]AZP10721.1 hydrolase [Undibacterium parvum]QJQ05332.1 hydrolase [Undibacterium piscinae]
MSLTPIKPAAVQHQGKYRNQIKMQAHGFWKTLAISWRFMFNKPANTVPSLAIPVIEMSQQQLHDAPDNSLFRLGHSTVLMKMQGEFWLTDPVFSERASPFQWMGPKRFHAAPISIEQLPKIKGVILSHDHYDHLDKAAIQQLAHKVEHFLTPLGVGDTLIAWGVDAAKVQQLDWWQDTTVHGIKFVATPSQHFSGRGLHDRNKSLWASWAILHQDMRIFFSGDSGYFDGFKQIGDAYGPFNLTLIETGAYDKLWPDVHMQPEESLQAHQDLRGQHLLPIHNGTFDLSLHAWYEPFNRIVHLAQQAGLPVSTPQMGELLNMASPHAGSRWWLRSEALTMPQTDSRTSKQQRQIQIENND